MSQSACKIYLITPPDIGDKVRFEEQLSMTLAAAPVACLQIRLKGVADVDWITLGRRIVNIAHRYGSRVVVNDRPDLVAPIGADGAHIGQSDMDYFLARKLLGDDAILGVTCHNSRDLAFEAAEAGADYVAFGAFFESMTKSSAWRAELEILTWWQETVEVPCVAIGGLQLDNVAPVIAAGADFIAVCSGVWDYAGGAPAAIRQFAALSALYS